MISKETTLTTGQIATCWNDFEKIITQKLNKETKDFFNISERYSASFEKLVHPVHTRGSVYGWTIKNK